MLRSRSPFAAILGVALYLPLAGCGDAAPPPAPGNEIAFTAEERILLEDTAPPQAPSGPVSRENYRQQLDALESEVAAEERR